MRTTSSKPHGGIVLGIAAFIVFLSLPLFAQTNPPPQILPYTQDFGAAAFSALPPGFAGWNGIDGAATLSQSAAEGSTPAGNAVMKSATVVQSPGGLYGYALNSNAKLYIQASNNATNGVNQLSLAIATKGKRSVKINYKITMLFPSSRTAGVVLQFRTGITGAWETLPNSVYEYNSSVRTAGQEDSFVDILLPAKAEDKDTIQLRWAVWHGIESGTVSGIGIDDINIYSGSGTAPPSSPNLASPIEAAVNQSLMLPLAWNASSSALGYRVQLSVNPEFNPVSFDSSAIAGLSVQISGLSNNTVYYWRVSASNMSGASAFSAARTFSTVWTLFPSAPLLLSPLKGAVVSSADLLCRWETSPGAMFYRCQISSDSLFAKIVFDDSLVAKTSVQIQGIGTDAPFWWRVCAQNNAGISSFSSVRNFITAPVYRVPQQLILAGQSGAQLAANLARDYTAAAVLSYEAAREKIYGEIDKAGDTLKCVYTGYACYMPPSVPPLTAAGNGGINAEHSFPQSVGAGTGNAGSDMQHIYAAKGNVNSARGNLPYGELTDNAVLTWYTLGTSISIKPSGYPGEYSKLGTSSFEPRNSHKGRVARSIFYFYTIYKAQSSAAFFEGMKETLLKWHSLYPVDSIEYARTVKIAAYQSGKVNPFIADTTLVRRVYDFTTGVSRTNESIPQRFLLNANYPNPFNPSTTLTYGLPADSRVRLHIFNALGQQVSDLVNAEQSAGWYSVSWNAAAASGIYFYRLEAVSRSDPGQRFVEVKKMILMR